MPRSSQTGQIPWRRLHRQRWLHPRTWPTIVPKEEPTVIPEKTEEKPEKTPAAAEQKPDPEKKKTAEAEPCSLCPVAVHSETSLDHTKAGTSF